MKLSLRSEHVFIFCVRTRYRDITYIHFKTNELSMKYTIDIEINQPIDRVIALFDSTENLYKWMEGLESFEPLSGEPGQEGARSRLKFKTGKREFEMIETILVRNFPHEFKAAYEAGPTSNSVSQKFSEVSESLTRMTTESEFQMKGAMKLMGWLMPGAFRKQTRKYQMAFKQFAESQ